MERSGGSVVVPIIYKGYNLKPRAFGAVQSVQPSVRPYNVKQFA